MCVRDEAALVLQREQRVDVPEATFGIDAPVRVAHGDDLRAGVVEQLRRDAADVAESLHRHRGAVERNAAARARLLRHEEHATPGRLEAPAAAAHRPWL